MRATDIDREAVTAALEPLGRWFHACHAASLHLVKSGVLPGSRVARGTCRGVGAQHSWVVVGPDCYADDAVIVDPTLWSYQSTCVGVWVGTAADGLHTPHGGVGSIWTWGKPFSRGGPAIPLTPAEPLSPDAELFLELVGPLDRHGWSMLAQAPVFGWPAAELIAAMDDTTELAALVPIDRLGMLTDRNPSGLYLPGDEPRRPGARPGATR